jgi:hypothetical protein
MSRTREPDDKSISGKIRGKNSRRNSLDRFSKFISNRNQKNRQDRQTRESKSWDIQNDSDSLKRAKEAREKDEKKDFGSKSGESWAETKKRMAANAERIKADGKVIQKKQKDSLKTEETLEEGSSGMKSMKRRGRPDMAKFSYKYDTGSERAYKNLKPSDKLDVRDAASRYTFTDQARKKTLLGMHAKMRRITRSPTAPKNDF